MIAVTNEQMKTLERLSDENGVSYKSLMINAGTNAAKKIAKIIIDLKHEKIIKNKKILFLAGKGNNGGDCFVSAQKLASEGFKVTVLMMTGEPKTELAQSMFRIIGTVGSEKIKIFYIENETVDTLIKIIDENATIIDGVFGTGFHGELPKNVKDVFEYINCQSDALKISYDIPSGGNGTIGSVAEHTFKADYTFTFGALKTGLVQYPLKSFCGEIEVINIGFTKNIFKEITPCIISDTETAQNALILGEPDSNKGDFGNLLAITGSESMPGACAMSSLSALKSGVGLLTVATVKANIPILATKTNEAMYLPLDTDENGFILFNQSNKNIISEKMKKASAVLIGCGLGVTEDTKELVKWIIINAACPVIIDADGLNCIAGNIEILKKASSKIIITPHPKEFSRLTGKSVESIQANRLQSAIDFSAEYPDTVLVLKGAGTIISENGKLAINTTGNRGMAKGGSGDVLAGIISALIARQKNLKSKDIFTAVSAAVYIHGKAGDFAKEKKSVHSMLPTDIINNLDSVFKYLEDWL